MDNLEKEIAKLLKNKLPRIVGKVAVDHFKENFTKGGFVDNGLKKWDDPKRLNAEGDSAGDKYGTLLSARNELYESINYSVNGYTITLRSDKEYAEIHNNGGDIQIPITDKMRRFAWFKHSEAVEESGDKKMKTMWKGLALTAKTELNVKIPQRQFIGQSKEMDDIVNNRIATEFDKIFKANKP